MGELNTTTNHLKHELRQRYERYFLTRLEENKEWQPKAKDN
jgi:hypothetical protein